MTGSFSGNGAGVTNVNLLNVNSQGAITFATTYGNFVSNSSPSVGTGPQSVVAADVNGDGKPDLISANAFVNGLSVLTNNGSGGFVLAASLVVGNFPDSVTSADVNGDGKPDLISANSAADTLSVLTNNGSGSFALAATPVVGDDPESVTSVDVNGDGKPDLISANFGNGSGNTLTVLTNNGSSGFVLASSPIVGSTPYSVTTADVNGDGKLDLISANYGNGSGNTLTILTNNGSGRFVLTSSPVVGSAPGSVMAADVNGDGKPDLISANAFANTLTVLFNNPTISGTFTGNGSGLNHLSADAIIGGLTTNIAILTPGPKTNTLFFTNGILRAIQ